MNLLRKPAIPAAGVASDNRAPYPLVQLCTHKFSGAHAARNGGAPDGKALEYQRYREAD